jgi:hypothetical protein
MSAKAQGAKTSAVHQQMARAHWMDAPLAREKTIALQCIKNAGRASAAPRRKKKGGSWRSAPACPICRD